MTPSNFYSVRKPLITDDDEAPMSETSLSLSLDPGSGNMKAKEERGEGNDNNLYALTGIDDRAHIISEAPNENRLSISKIRGHENIGRRLNGTVQMVQNILKSAKNKMQLQ